MTRRYDGYVFGESLTLEPVPGDQFSFPSVVDVPTPLIWDC